MPLVFVRYRAAATWTRVLAVNDKDHDNNVDLTGFNPFQYQARGNRAYGMSGTQISLRKTGMQQLVAQLLNVRSDQQISEILTQHMDFLLEPLEDTDAVLDPDSIYKGEMNRSQRYQAYKESMQERLSTARDPNVVKVLQAMRDFVVSFE
jgi:hypothetical protein